MKKMEKPLARVGGSACAAALVAGLFAGCGSQGAAEELVVQAQAPQGSLGLALTVSGYRVDEVQVTVASETLDLQLVRSRSLVVSDPHATVSLTEYGLPAGSYGVSLVAQPVDDPATELDESAVACAGSVSGIAVVAGEITEVPDLVLLCGEGGGDVQTAGGITVHAEVEVDLTPACGNLVRELYVGPMQTSVGQQVDLATVVDEGVNVTWSARAGAFSADQSTYTCPAVAGTYELTATFVRDEECERTVTREVVCKSAYEGSCEPLPSSFALEGSCGLRSPCHVEQQGCAWEASCRGQVLRGEGAGNSYPFIDNEGRVCTGSIVDGRFAGSCVDESEQTCEFQANEAPALKPYCAPLPKTISNVTACGESHASCDVIQDGCTYQASCNGGADLISGTVQDNSLRWDTTVAGKSVRCTGELVDGKVAGSCAERGRDIVDPLTCDDFAIDAPSDGAGGSCEETLPSEGFALAGCGLDNLCFATQRNCVWQVACGEQVYGGTASEANQFAFTTADGRSCTGSVVDGEFVGSCEGGGESCQFAPTELAPIAGCFEVPARVQTGGCGAFWDCDVVQSGCDFQARCQGGEYAITGTARPTGITFPGLTGYTCAADVNEDGTRLLGECTRPNDDGTVSQCRDLTEQQGARLAIDWD